MDSSQTEIRKSAQQAAAAGDWPRVTALAMQIAQQAPNSPDAPFFMGLAQKASRNSAGAAGFFEKALQLQSGRYDAAIELASQYVVLNRSVEARELLQRYSEELRDNAYYLDMAAQAYFAMGLYENAWPLFELAVQLRPNAEEILAHKAACAVYLGKIDTAKSIYRKILKRHPQHQQTHYELAQLERASNDRHIRQMLQALRKSSGVAANNIYIFYALGKEYEDMGKWSDAFRYFEKAGDAVKSVANYNVADDVELMDEIIATCSTEWLQEEPSTIETARTPIFIVGLPRTGTTLTDRILSSHSKVQSAGESQLLQMVLRDGSRAGNQIGITPAQIESASKKNAASIAEEYINAVEHRLGAEPYFIEKLPENVLYLGFIAKAWPNAKIIHLRRHPLDACFAAYKQSYFRFAYSLDDLADYYLAYDRLTKHWRKILGSRMLELKYEDLVADSATETRQLLEKLELEFEESCLLFEQNVAPVATASSVQVREKIHARSVDRWKKFEKELLPLRLRLEQGGVVI